MLDLELIDNTIDELEQEDTNFSICEKLAALYTVKHFYKAEKEPIQGVEKEYHDILPQYKQYCDIKQHYQLNQASKQQVLDSLKRTCKEIQEFFHTLYSSTDMPEEREQLDELIRSL